MVFQELAPSQSHKIKSRRDLEAELFDDALSTTTTSRIRDNEGEAAEHGIYFDDTEYDYMQHIRDLNSGDGEGEAMFVEARGTNKEKKGKEKVSLEQALREANLGSEHDGNPDSLFGEELSSSRNLGQPSYQDQQDVPDAIAGFQPDMDPRLREVLEALDDEAYVEDEESFFGHIATEGGEEVTQEEFEDSEFFDGEDEDGWESDTTEKPTNEYTNPPPVVTSPLSADVDMGDIPVTEASDHGDGNWMKEFSKFKQDQKISKNAPAARAPAADVQSSVMTGTSLLSNGRKKKRKGAMTSSSGYSMTSSSLARTEGLSLLDARFDRIEEEYADDDGDMDIDDDGTASMFSKNSMASKGSNLSTKSQAPELTNTGFEGMMDDFLGEYPTKSAGGRRKAKQQGYPAGLANLDAVRKELGPAKIRTR